MCGIAGIFYFDPGRVVEVDAVKSMCDAIVHRGPNDAGYWTAGSVGLGVRRLSIIDVGGGHQPISNEDGTLWIVFNGEVFNHVALRSELKQRGHRFTTTTDTEVIVHLYEEEGQNCLRHLRGMFAFAIWDSRKNQLFIARDRLGIKPLYYALGHDSLLFGSEIKTMLSRPMISRNMDWTAIDAYFAYGYIPAPFTAYKSIRQLLPGHFLIAERRGVTLEQYWDLAMTPKLSGRPDDIAQEFVSLFRDSVKMRLMSEVPLGAFLSGGIDSSLVVAMMNQNGGESTRTFTIGFGGDTGSFLDERPFAREVSARYQTNHREFSVMPTPEEAIDAALFAFDQPFADDSLIPTHSICQAASKDVTVALTGLGGDESFGGYERFRGFALSSQYDRIPRFVRDRILAPVVHGLREPRNGENRINHLKRFVDGAGLSAAARWQSYQMIANRQRRRALYVPTVAREIDFDAVDMMGTRYFEQVDTGDLLDRALYQDIKMYLPDDLLALTDRVGMRHSLELRVPFLDHKLVEFCARIPTSMKLRWGQKKYLLRRVARDYLPASVMNHRKQGFASPMAIWLRGDLRPYVDATLSPDSVERYQVLNPRKVQCVLQNHYQRRTLNDKQIFSMLMFQAGSNGFTHNKIGFVPTSPVSSSFAVLGG